MLLKDTSLTDLASETSLAEATLTRHPRQGPLLDTVYGNVKWVFPKIGVPENGWFLMIKIADLGVPFFLETPQSAYSQAHRSESNFFLFLLRFSSRCW